MSQSLFSRSYVADVDCSGVVDVAFLLHSAGSVHAERWHYMTQFVADVISKLDVHPDRTRVSAVHWSDAAHVAFPLSRYTTRQDAVEVIAAKGIFNARRSSKAMCMLLHKHLYHFRIVFYAFCHHLVN